MWNHRRSGYAQENVVESYLTSVESVESLYPRIEVTGRAFSRTINRQDGLPDVYIHQSVHPDNLYMHSAVIPSVSLTSRIRLAEGIQCVPPAFTPTSLQYMRLRDNTDDWRQFAEFMSNCAYNSATTRVLRNPFVLRAEQAFGTVYIDTGSRDWDFWKEVPWAIRGNGFIINYCPTCLEDFQADVTVSDQVGFICGHLFHKHCIRTWMWTNASLGHQTNCPLCGVSPIA